MSRCQESFCVTFLRHDIYKAGRCLFVFEKFRIVKWFKNCENCKNVHNNVNYDSIAQKVVEMDGNVIKIAKNIMKSAQV